MDISDKTNGLKSLEMAKKHIKKVYITDIAIDKVPLIEYYGFTDEQNQVMQELVKTCWLFLKRATIVMKLL